MASKVASVLNVRQKVELDVTVPQNVKPVLNVPQKVEPVVNAPQKVGLVDNAPQKVDLVFNMPRMILRRDGARPPLLPTPCNWNPQHKSNGQNYVGRAYPMRKILGKGCPTQCTGIMRDGFHTKHVNLRYVADKLALYWHFNLYTIDDGPVFSKHLPNYPIWSYGLFSRPKPNAIDIIMVEFMQVVILNIRIFPYNYDYTTPKVLRILDDISHRKYALSNIIEHVYNEAVFNSNFRFFGAKMFGLLHMLNPQPQGLFLDLLQRKCEHQECSVVEYMRTKQQVKARNNAYFLAEVYMQLRCECNRQKVLARSLCFILSQLLGNVVNENLRCVCTILKIVGSDLLLYCYLELLPVLCQLEVICVRYPGKYSCAAYVLHLHNSVWGGVSRKLDIYNVFKGNEIAEGDKRDKITKDILDEGDKKAEGDQIEKGDNTAGGDPKAKDDKTAIEDKMANEDNISKEILNIQTTESCLPQASLALENFVSTSEQNLFM